MTRYTIEYGSYYLRAENGDIRVMTDQVAMAYDTETFSLMKHGAPEQVMAWHREAAKKARGVFTLAVVTFPRDFDPEVLNRILATSCYLGVVLKELGVLEETPAIG